MPTILPFFQQVELEAYRISIEALASKGENDPFENSGPDHGAIVMGNIFRTASENVKVYAGDFNGNVSDKPYYIKYLKEYLAKNKPLTIIFEKTPNKNSGALKAIFEDKDEKKRQDIKVMKLNTDVNILRDTANYKYNHFTLADSKMFRIEEKDDYSAICSFNDKKIASAFETLFDEFVGKSIEIDIDGQKVA